MTGQTAVVTGASSGIGRAIALQFAAAGANVIVHAATNRDAAEEVAKTIIDAGRDAKVILADISATEDRKRLVEKAFAWKPRCADAGGGDKARDGGDKAGTVSVWVNNAGVDVLTGDAARWSFHETLARLWAVDVEGTIALSRAAGERMRNDKDNDSAGGVILNMGWDQAATGQGGDSGEIFATSKGAIMAFSRSLARSLAPHVRVNCLAPGWIRTAWGDEVAGYWDERARGESLLERWGSPKDVAAAALFLASPAAAFINGQVLPVNGGSQPWPNGLARRDDAGNNADDSNSASKDKG